MQYKIHAQYQREGLFEISFDIMEDDGTLIVGNLIRTLGKEKPTEKLLDTEFINKIYPEVVESLTTIIAEETMRKSEVEELLKEKGYLEENEKLEDLKVKIGSKYG